MPDDDAPLETFDLIDSPHSIDSNRSNEGTNAARFALLGLINTRAEDAMVGLNDIVRRFGFNPELLIPQHRQRFNENESINWEGDFEELRYVLQTWFADGTDLSQIRRQSWNAFNDGDLSARVALLAAGICSGLERESAVAAAALIGNLKVAPARSAWRSPRVELFWQRSHESLDQSDEWLRSLWPYAVPILQGDSPSEGDWNGASVWDSNSWTTLSQKLLLEALDEFGGQAAILHVLTDLAWLRVKLARRSTDEIVQQFPVALSIRLKGYGMALRKIQVKIPHQFSINHFGPSSTLVHGTFARHGTWWKPKGDFFQFVTEDLRPCLYGGNDRFNWSGLYTESSRRAGGNKLKRWADSHTKSSGMQTIFAHSCGAEVAARAIYGGMKVEELVLLSAPVNHHVDRALALIPTSFDVRLNFDIVLALAGYAQRFRNVLELQRTASIPPERTYHSKRYFWEHGATHTREFWETEDVSLKINFKR